LTNLGADMLPGSGTGTGGMAASFLGLKSPADM
jgi:hypothetical protein